MLARPSASLFCIFCARDLRIKDVIICLMLEKDHFSRGYMLQEGILPHGKRFMFLESVEIVEPGKKARGKLADRRLPEFSYLEDHIPGYPIFPGALSLEALAELSGIAVLSDFPIDNNKFGALRKGVIELEKPIELEDDIDLEAEVIFFRMNTGRTKVRALNGEEVVAHGEVTFMLTNVPNALNSKIS